MMFITYRYMEGTPLETQVGINQNLLRAYLFEIRLIKCKNIFHLHDGTAKVELKKDQYKDH